MIAGRSISSPGDLAGMRVTVMGLGLHGGGLATAQYLAAHGAEVTATDLQSEDALRSTLAQLPSSVQVVLEAHRQADFTSADMVVKNPGVPSDSSYLGLARRARVPITTDISLFCSLYPDNPRLVVTGSKGKSTTAAALHSALRTLQPAAQLGGNITVSPLQFADALTADAPVVLELSSWQLGDLPDPAALAARVAVLTNVLPDHLDRYPSMAAYAADKLRVFAGQGERDTAVVGPNVARWLDAAPAGRTLYLGVDSLPPAAAGAWVAGNQVLWRDVSGEQHLLIGAARLVGQHNLLNLAGAGLALLAFAGVERLDQARAALERFTGLEHRLEPVAHWHGIQFVNDSAATMPHATAAALQAVAAPVTLIAGGNDKQLDFSVLTAAPVTPQVLVLLAGTATAKVAEAVGGPGVTVLGPYRQLDAAVAAAAAATPAGGTVLFSPAATSFGMFANEFDRGAQFKQAVAELTGGQA